MVHVALVDGCSTYRRGLREALEESRGVTVVDECDTAEAAMALCAAHEVDVLVVDIDLPDQSGIELCRRIGAEHPDVHVVLLGYWDWDVHLAAARVVRAHGYLLRKTPTRELVVAIQDASRRLLFSSEQLERIGHWGSTVGQLLVTLSPRQWNVLWLVAGGLSNRDIAVRLTLSENTVEKHIGAILQKLHVHSRSGLLGFIMQHHLEVLNPNWHDDIAKTAVEEWLTRSESPAPRNHNRGKNRKDKRGHTD